MRTLAKHIILIIASISISLVSAQENLHKGYRIEGDEVVFTFYKDDYTYLTNDVYHDVLETTEVYIKTVAVAGEFNNWSRDKWQMIRISDNLFEFRKKIAEFTNQFDWEFKFVINNHYWAEPSQKDGNIVKAKTKYGQSLHVYNLKMFTAFPSDIGNATFKLKGYTNAKKVILSGTFNRWDETIFRMKRVVDGWKITLQLNPDIYQYKFIVDGEWIEDPGNPNKKLNEFNGYNSVIDVKKDIVFKLFGHTNAENVTLAGSFNDWSKDDLKLSKTEKGWQITTKLSGGKHHYKFIVDGEWITDPDNPVKEYDDKGNINSVCMVR